MNKVKKLDLVLVYIILLNLLLIRYRRVLYTELYVPDLLILFYVFLNSVKSGLKLKLSTYLSLLFLVIVLATNAITFGLGSVFIDNIKMIFSPLVYIVFLNYLIKKYDFEAVEKLAFHLKKILNIYFFVNILIVLIQAKTETFLMNKFLGYNPAPFDHMDGLIGANGVGVLNFLWITTLLFNLYFYIRSRKKAALILFLVEFSLMFFVSKLNDNKMFLLTTALIFLTFYIIKGFKIKLKISFLKVSLFYFVLPIILSLLILNPAIIKTVENSALMVGSFSFGGSTTPDPNNERAYLNYLAFNKYNANILGIGLQNVDMADQSIHVHLGINSSSLLLIQGGIIFLFSVIHFYIIMILKLFKGLSIRRKITFYFAIGTAITTMSYATQIFRDQYLSTCLMFIYLVFYLINKSSMTQKEDTVIQNSLPSKKFKFKRRRLVWQKHILKTPRI